MRQLAGLSNQTLLSVLEILLEQNFEAVVVTDGDPIHHKIMYANDLFCNMTGYSRDELYGNSPGMLSGEKTNPAVINRLKQALNQGIPFTGATTNYRKNGSSYSVQWNIYPVLGDDGRPSHYVSIQKDLTQLRGTLNRLKSSSQSFRQFLAELSGKDMLTPEQVDLQHAAQQQLQSNAVELAPYVNTQPAAQLDDDDEFFDADFFDFDDMATEGAEPARTELSAQDFLRSAEIDTHAVNDICTIANSLERLFEALEIHEMSISDRKELIEELQEMSNSIFFVEEFIDISIALSELAVCMLHYYQEPLDFMIAEALRGLTNDLITWVNGVFISQEADDVHWLDNSIIGSCKQILVFMRMQFGNK